MFLFVGCLFDVFDWARKGARRDVLVILLANALIIPLCKRVGLSPVLGFLSAGILLGPNCLSIVSDVKAIEVRFVRASAGPVLTTNSASFR